MPEKLPANKAELLEEVDTTWTAINDALDDLTPEQMVSPTDDMGWAVKDHLTHMGAWDDWAVFVMQGKPPWEGMGISEAVYRADQAGETDAGNAAVFARHKDKTPDEARAYLTSAHDRLMGLALAMSEEELAAPFRPLRPDESPDRVISPALHVIYETTADHYAEHLGWFRALAAG